MIEPTVMRGSSEAAGSWKIICRPRRTLRSSLPPIDAEMSLPAKFTVPLVGS